jgi:hypothetical protein
MVSVDPAPPSVKVILVPAASWREFESVADSLPIVAKV